MKPTFLRAATALILVLSISIIALGDTIRLKDGSVVKGKVIGFTDGKFVVLIGDGNRQRQMSFFADEVQSVEFDSPKPADVVATTKASDTGATTAVKVSAPGVIEPKSPDSKTEAPKINTNPTASPSTSLSKNTTQTVSQSTPAPKPRRMDPIKIGVKVLADNTANGWTNSGWIVRKGQRIKINGTGRISLGSGRYTTPSGIGSLGDETRLVKGKPTGALIAVVGDDNNDFIFIGSTGEFVATRDGALFLGINECDGCLDDNSGAYEIVIEVDPSTGN